MDHWFWGFLGLGAAHGARKAQVVIARRRAKKTAATKKGKA
jgi:hypothetical protein